MKKIYIGTVLFLILTLLFLNTNRFNFEKKECDLSNYAYRDLDGCDSENENQNDTNFEMHCLSDRSISIPYSSFFTNLTENIGNNDETQATCGYVALAALLNYYDCVVNDDIVPNQFEVDGNDTTSPGTLYEQDSGLPFNSVALYYNYLRTYYKNSSLHAFLILLSHNALDINPVNVSQTYMGEFGTNSYILANALDDYFSFFNLNYSAFQNRVTIDENDTLSIINSKFEMIKNEIIGELDDGKPVVVGFNGHAMVAYEYDYSKLYVHNGYNSSSPHQTLKEFTWENIKTYLIAGYGFGYTGIDVASITHLSHSYNYVDSDNHRYCICGEYQHIHNYTYNFVDYNSNRHYAYCSCGSYILQRHDYFIYQGNNPCRCGRYMF